ncbi:endoglucanase [Magnaporthiopsis poae ATCC 64411]|uniref:Endoglucanase n=1 Tax=Magnaporthiopsis poae (strain ATCC 64411 / 73-15) TaxID=644358 RepID=A0A0C4EEU3_MAGP6|nr:endoglucanase [Magnaporthiopsis poae ATCC 64411]
MPSFFTAATLLALAATVVQGHMEMSYPPPLRSKFNSFATTKDSDMTAPLSPSGANYPCKGYLSDLGTPGGKPVVTFTPGQKSNMTIVGGAAHNGGSCQASLSFDKGKTFTVIQSIIGDCPVNGGSSFDFTIPDDAPAGDAVFAWSWSNKVGNAEFYMNCASVTIAGAKNKIRGMPRPRAAVAFSARPAMFVSNIGNGCKTENMVVDYPNPGPDVTRNGQATAPSCDGGAVVTVMSGKCSDEGAYNCINGSSFQRCASGSWSVPIPMAPGTTCTVGQSNVLDVAKRRFRRGGPRRVDTAWERAD